MLSLRCRRWCTLGAELHTGPQHFCHLPRLQGGKSRSLGSSFLVPVASGSLPMPIFSCRAWPLPVPRQAFYLAGGDCLEGPRNIALEVLAMQALIAHRASLCNRKLCRVWGFGALFLREFLGCFCGTTGAPRRRLLCRRRLPAGSREFGVLRALLGKTHLGSRGCR